MNSSPIGIIDSGSGGLSIYQAVKQLLPQESFLYVGDHGHMPYSEKPSTYIIDRVEKIIHFQQEKKIKLCIIACNTATVAGIEDYRKSFPDIPIIGVVPVIKTAVEKTKTGHIGILSTPFTNDSEYLRQLIMTYATTMRVDRISGGSLVEYIEKGIVEGPVIQKYLEQLLLPIRKNDIDIFVLGCTHYPFIKKLLHSLLGEHILLLDSAAAVARHTERILRTNYQLCMQTTKNTDIFYTTGPVSQAEIIAHTLMNAPITYNFLAL